MELFVQSLVTGIMLGGLYAVIGIGLTLVFGIMGLTNIAHGDLMILGSFFVMVIASTTGNVWIALAVGIVIMIIVGGLSQKFLINKVIDKGAEPALLITFGMSIVIKNVLQLIFGADSMRIPSPFSSVNVINTKWVNISGQYFFNFIVAIVVILVLNYIIKKTDFGRSIRAAASNVVGAELMGVNTKRTYIYAMGIALATGCIAGLLVGQSFVFYSYSGTQYLIIAFGVVVIGGMGSLVGTLLGGIILGVAQLMGAYFLGTGYQIVIGYLTLIVILTFRPRGLMSNMVRK